MTKSNKKDKTINEDYIRVAAYYIWEQEGRPQGRAEEFWIRACDQLLAPKAATKKKPATVAKATKTVAKPATKVEAKKEPAKPCAKKSCAKPATTVKKAKPAGVPFYAVV